MLAMALVLLDFLSGCALILHPSLGWPHPLAEARLSLVDYLLGAHRSDVFYAQYAAVQLVLWVSLLDGIYVAW
jgi:hypothetical protein